ncbi:protein-export chaperone SecB [Sinimarinibacterium sp. NLF-5-8]|uniref:protein-export chaperone SecB n=1 Tax=Sinimarinibacterium sp. NLF-5-8 TaxID=2698684 RepID=UPI00137C01C2|nr:protein-export chaperone SecB [Sinimarinibacterium sp. NLF-5-8]QHS11047.1 protein-export chaperone SecB [Sinimarinibacterium sp. NLF-5-8]
MAEQQPAPANEAPLQRTVQLQKIYCKDASLEVPQAPQIFTRQWKPQVDVQVNTEIKQIQGEHYHVVLTITATAKLDEDVAFLVEVHQAGIFAIVGFDDAAERQAVLGAYCPAQIFPFARETVADLVERAGFPQLLLQPINFDALYLEHQKQAQQQQAAAPATTH